MAHKSHDQAEAVAQLIAWRQTVSPKRLMEPGPQEQQVSQLFQAAACAPDHGQINPWRLLIIPKSRRSELGDLFAQALLERDASATLEQVCLAREKAFHAPFLMLLIVDEGEPAHEIDACERVLAAGCAVQSILLLATAMGYGTALTSGKALKSNCLRDSLGLRLTERAICFLNVGTVESKRPFKPRPNENQFVNVWGNPA